MDFLERATKYVLDLLTENEELKKFPKEFVNESVKWVKTWFLIPEDPVSSDILSNKGLSEAVKKPVLEAKMKALESDATFMKELEAKLAIYTQHKTRLKNIITDANIDVQGSVHIGDKGSSIGDNYDEKNSIKGSTIKTGGDFRIGDDVISGNQNVQIVHNHNHIDSDSKSNIPRRKILIWVSSILASISAAIGINFYKKPDKIQDSKPQDTPKINVQGNNNVINDMSGSDKNIINQTIIQKGEKDSLKTKKGKN